MADPCGHEIPPNRVPWVRGVSVAAATDVGARANEAEGFCRPDAEHAADLIECHFALSRNRPDAGLGMDLRRADVGVPEGLLYVRDVHADREQPCRQS